MILFFFMAAANALTPESLSGPPTWMQGTPDASSHFISHLHAFTHTDNARTHAHAHTQTRACRISLFSKVAAPPFVSCAPRLVQLAQAVPLEVEHSQLLVGRQHGREGFQTLVANHIIVQVQLGHLVVRHQRVSDELRAGRIHRTLTKVSLLCTAIPVDVFFLFFGDFVGGSFELTSRVMMLV